MSNIIEVSSAIAHEGLELLFWPRLFIQSFLQRRCNVSLRFVHLFGCQQEYANVESWVDTKTV